MSKLGVFDEDQWTRVQCDHGLNKPCHASRPGDIVANPNDRNLMVGFQRQE